MNTYPSAQPDNEQPEIDLGVSDAVDIVFRRKWIVVAVMLLVVGASVLSTAKQKTTYTSSASLIVTTAAQTSVEAQQLLITAKQLASSEPVAAIAARRLAVKEPRSKLLAGLSVAIPTSTQLIQFTYSSSTPQAAQRRAAAFVAAFQEYQGQMLDGLASASRSIDERLTALRFRVSAARIAASETDIASLTAEIATLEDKRTALLNTAPVASTIAEPAATAVRNEPSMARAAVVGIVAGLVVGILAAWAVDFVARRRAKPLQPTGSLLPSTRRFVR